MRKNGGPQSLGKKLERGKTMGGREGGRREGQACRDRNRGDRR